MAVAVVLAVGALLAAGPAWAGNADLAAGLKALQAGKADPAVKSLSKVITGKGVDGADITLAYYYRGLAYHKAGKQASAIADLTNALWLKGLSAQERQDAIYNRGMAYQAAGLSDRAAKDFASAGKAPAAGDGVAATAPVLPAATPSIAAAPASGSQGGDWQTSVAASGPASSAPAGGSSGQTASAHTNSQAASQAASQTASSATSPATSSSGGLASLFSGVFGGSSSNSTPPAAASLAPVDEGKPSQADETLAWAAPDASSAASSPQASGSGAWATGVSTGSEHVAAPAQEPSSGGLGSFFSGIFGGGSTQSAGDQTASITPSASSAAADWQGSVAAGSPPGAGYHLQLASLRSQAEAVQYVGGLEQTAPDLVHSHPAQVSEQVLGNMGTFYNVILGPFQDERTALKACNELQRSGHDCFLVSK